MAVNFVSNQKEFQMFLDQMRVDMRVDFIGVAKNIASSKTPKDIRWVAVSGSLGEDYRTIRLRIGYGIAGLVWRTGRTMHESNIQSQPKRLVDYPIARLERLDQVIAHPLLINQQIRAVLLIGNRIDSTGSSKQSLPFIEQIEQSIEYTKLEKWLAGTVIG